MQLKAPGISLLLSLGVSLLMLIMAFGLLNSVERTFERDITLERSLQFYYALEGGIENALFHKNARGKGTHMPETANQNLAFHSDSLSNTWGISAQENPLLGLIREGDSLEIPLSIPQAITPEETVFSKKEKKFSSSNTFNLEIYKKTSDMPEALRKRFESRFGTIDLEGLVLSDTENPLVGWHFSRLNDGKKELFRPPNAGAGSICDGNLDPDQIPFRLCAQDLSPTNTQTDWASLISGDTKKGHLETLDNPSSGMVDLNDFLKFGEAHYTDFRLHLFTLGSFDARDAHGPTKIPGIPFSLTLSQGGTTSSEGFGSESFILRSTIKEGTDFAREVEIKLPEKSPNTLFNYVILE